MNDTDAIARLRAAERELAKAQEAAAYALKSQADRKTNERRERIEAQCRDAATKSGVGVISGLTGPLSFGMSTFHGSGFSGKLIEAHYESGATKVTVCATEEKSPRFAAIADDGNGRRIASYDFRFSPTPTDAVRFVMQLAGVEASRWAALAESLTT